MHIQSSITRVVTEINKTFEDFTSKFESIMGKLDVSVFEDAKSNPAEVKKKIFGMRGCLGLMIFNVTDHTMFTELMGFHKKAKLYEIGNPIGATNVTSIDLQTALYIPFRLLVYECEKETFAIYDLPSSIFEQFNQSEIKSFALMLDDEIKQIIAISDT